MTIPQYLETPIAEQKFDEAPRYGMTVDGYTKRSGAPTCTKIRLEGEKIWRRVMCWQFSNAGTLFVRVRGRELIVRGLGIPEINIEDRA